MIKGTFDADGFPQGFYIDGINSVVPEDAIEITHSQWQEFINNPGIRRWINGEVVQYTPPVVKVVTQSVSDRQFIQALAEHPYQLITWDEAEAWGARGDLPKLALDGLEKIEDEDLKKRARYFLKTAKQFDRKHWATDLLGALLKWESSQLDDLWNFADTL